MSNNSDDSDEYFPPLPPLRRTHRATCRICFGVSETQDPEQRINVCYKCKLDMLKLIVRRRTRERRRHRREQTANVVNNELLQYQNIQGNDITAIINSFMDM